MTKEELREKRENYWYHYKWHTLLGIFLAFCLVWTVMDYSSKNKIDLDITYIGDYMDCEGLGKEIAKTYKDIIPDKNNDGEIRVEVNAIYTSEDISPDKDLNFWQRIDIDLVNGESYIYLIDDYLLSDFMERGANGVIKTKDGYKNSIDISENEFFIPYLPEGRKVYLCVRQSFLEPSEEIEKIEKTSLEFLENFL